MKRKGKTNFETVPQHDGTDLVKTNDGRLSDARTPTNHATSHKSGGGDAVKLDELASPTDITTLNATTGLHGLLPKLGGGTTNFLRADGSWSAPAGGSGVTVETYTWYESDTMPYINYKGAAYGVRDRIMFAGTAAKTASKIYVILEVDSASTADVKVYDVTNDAVIVEKTGLNNTSWQIIDLGTLSNQSSGQAIWEIQVKTSASNKYIRASSMRVEF